MFSTNTLARKYIGTFAVMTPPSAGLVGPVRLSNVPSTRPSTTASTKSGPLTGSGAAPIARTVSFVMALGLAEMVLPTQVSGPSRGDPKPTG